MVPAGLSLGRVVLDELWVHHIQPFPEATTTNPVASLSPPHAHPAGPVAGLRDRVAGGFPLLPQHLSLSRLSLQTLLLRDQSA